MSAYDYTSYLQGRIDEVCAAGGGVVDIAPTAGPKVQWSITKPLHVYNPGVTLKGSGKDASTLRMGLDDGSQTFTGPMIYVGRKLGTLPTVTTGRAGLGPAWDLDNTASKWLNLRDHYATWLDGLGQFAFECFWRCERDEVTGTHVIASCNGQWLTDHGRYSTFALMTDSLNGNGEVLAELKVGTTAPETRAILRTAPGTVVPGKWYHFLVDYNGTTIRLVVTDLATPSTHTVVSSAATGNVYQHLLSDFALGSCPGSFPEGGSMFYVADQIASVRVSRVSRWSSNYTAPTVNHAEDGNTLFLCNFDNQYDSFVRARCGTGTHVAEMYCAIRGPTPGFMGAFTARDFSLVAQSAGGILLNGVVNTDIRSVYQNGGMFGVYMRDNCYFSNIRDFRCQIGSYAAAGIILAHASGVVNVDGCYAIAGGAGLVISDSSATVTGGCFQGRALHALVNGHGSSGVVMFHNVALGDEAVGNEVFQASLAVGGIPSFLMACGTIETFNSTGPMVLVSGNGRVKFDSTAFNALAQTECRIKVLKPENRTKIITVSDLTSWWPDGDAVPDCSDPDLVRAL